MERAAMVISMLLLLLLLSLSKMNLLCPWLQHRQHTGSVAFSGGERTMIDV